MHRAWRTVVAVSFVGVSAALASACPPGTTEAKPTTDPGTTDTSGVPEWMVRLAPDVDSPAAKKYAAQQKTRRQIERDLKKIRAEYFRSTRNTEVRQIGITRLRAYTDPALYPLLWDLFKSEDRDVREAILNHFFDQKTDEGDAAIAWGAVFDSDPWYREAATTRSAARAKEVGSVSDRVKWAAAAGLRSRDEKTIAAAAGFARDLRMYDAIPEMINLQVGGGGGAGAGSGSSAGGMSFGDPGTSLAYIIVGKQQAFVSDLQPVVGDNAVAFDPTLSVVTEGVVLRVIDAVVITYRTEVNAALIALGNAGWDGRSTASLGWDQAKWREWYAGEFQPYRKRVDALAQSAPPASK